MRGPSRQPRRRGIATVEAAAVLPLIVLVVFGFIELGYVLNSHHLLQDAARQGARAAVHADNSNAQVQAAVLGSLNNSIAVDPTAVTVRISKLTSSGAEEYQVMALDDNERGNAIRVTVTLNYNQFDPPTDFLGLANREVSSSVVMRRQR
jgi:Flp pilus assembly protein TadG